MPGVLDMENRKWAVKGGAAPCRVAMAVYPGSGRKMVGSAMTCRAGRTMLQAGPEYGRILPVFPGKLLMILHSTAIFKTGKGDHSIRNMIREVLLKIAMAAGNWAGRRFTRKIMAFLTSLVVTCAILSGIEKGAGRVPIVHQPSGHLPSLPGIPISGQDPALFSHH